VTLSQPDRIAARRLSRRSIMKSGSAALAAGVIAGGAARAQSASPAATPQVGQGDYVQAAVDQLDGIVADVLKRSGVPGMAVAIVAPDQAVALKGYGLRALGQPEKVDAQTVFQLASMSKPISSTIVAGVIGDGKTTWDAKLADLDPSFQMDDPWVTSQITIRDMFCHRSGLPDHAGDLLEDLSFDRATILHRLRFQPPASSFRSHYAYTNFGLTEGAVAAANAAGAVWDDLAASRLYQPLGMTATSSRYADYLARTNRAHGHQLINGTFVLATTPRDPDPESPAGGVSSNVTDLAKWVRLQLGLGMFEGQRIIAADPLAETHRPQIVSSDYPDPVQFYGLGWNASQGPDGAWQYSHSGAFNLGAGTTVYVLPSLNAGIVALTSTTPVGAPETVALSLIDILRTGKVQRDWWSVVAPEFVKLDTPAYGIAVDYSKPPANPAPHAPFTAYVASYANDFFGAIDVGTVSGNLVLRMGPEPRSFPMQHWDRDVFLYQPIGENAYGPSAVTFTLGADGRASSVTIENLDIHHTGTFTRVTPAT
jgi:CubicO group peptidase (beta-lactamase class C family)